MNGSDVDQRLAAAINVLWEQVCEAYPQQVADAQAMIALDPELAGIRVQWSEEFDRLDVVWTGRYLGSIDGPYLRGERDA